MIKLGGRGGEYTPLGAINMRKRVHTGRNSCICEIRTEKKINIKIKKEGARGNYIRRTLEYA